MHWWILIFALYLVGRKPAGSPTSTSPDQTFTTFMGTNGGNGSASPGTTIRQEPPIRYRDSQGNF